MAGFAAGWIDPMMQKKIEFRKGDTIISVPAKSGTTWTMNIFHQLRTGGDPDFDDIYRYVPWIEFVEDPGQTAEELLERWKSMPADVPRGFKTHASPGPVLDFRDDVNYVVVARNPEESIVSFFPFVNSHTDVSWEVWGAQAMQKDVNRDSFEEFFEEVALKFNPTPGPCPQDGMLTLFYSSFINGWWPHRHKKNVLMIHFSEMKRDHEASISKIASFLGYNFDDKPEQWARIIKYTSFPWMKAHQEKFELQKICKFGPFLNPGGMVRQGTTGAQAKDGMNERIARVIRQHMDTHVTDAAAVEWMYCGGVIA